MCSAPASKPRWQRAGMQQSLMSGWHDSANKVTTFSEISLSVCLASGTSAGCKIGASRVGGAPERLEL